MKLHVPVLKPWSALLVPLLWGCSDENAHQQTPFIVYTVIQHAVIDLSKSKGEFADTLTKYFGTTTSEGKDVIGYVEEMQTRDKVEAEVEIKIRESLTKLSTGELVKTRQRFLINVISPYIQCTLHGNPLPPDLRQAIQDRYVRYYAGGTSSNGLSAVIASIESYRTGSVFYVDSLNQLNLQLRAHGNLLQLSNRTKQACLLDVADTLLPPTTWKSGTVSVIEAKRNIPCILPSEYGYSTMTTDYVIVMKDRISEHAHEFVSGVEPSWNGKYYQSSTADQIFTGLGLNMNSGDANKIIQALVQRDFAKLSIDQIIEDLTVETAIHEAKHKTDEIDLPTMKLNWDCEISAHLAQTICSKSPFHSLVDAIGRIEGFYIQEGDPEMAKLLVQLWNIAVKAANPSYTKDNLQQDIKQVYEGYVTFSSKTHFPALSDFFQTIAPTIKSASHLRNIPPNPAGKAWSRITKIIM